MKQLVTLCCILLLAVTAKAGEVTLEWDASPSPEVTKYRVYASQTCGAYNGARFLEVPSTSLITKVTNLAPGMWCFVASALDNYNSESEFSNEVSTTVAPIEFKITSLSVSMRWFGVVLLCTTSTNSSAILRYTDLQTGERQTVIATPDASKSEHRAVLYLPMGQVRYYRYEWTVTDATGAIATETGTFQVR